MGELLAEVGDLVFSLVVGYLGALEFLYVVRHLYHWTFRHPNEENNDADSLKRLQDDIRNQLDNSEARETAGVNAMQDGVLYKDGFRIDPHQAEIDQLKAELDSKEEKDARRKQIEAELARQKRIEEETRKQLEEAEAELERQRKKAAAEKKKEEEEERNNRALLEAEREKQRLVEIEKEEKEENEKKLLAAEREREEKQRRREELERAEAARSIEAEQRRLEEARNMRLSQLEVDREKEEQQHEIEQREKRELEEQERAEAERTRLLMEAEAFSAAEQQRLQEEREAEEAESAFVAAERDRELREAQEEEQQDASEQARSLLEAEREEERKQRAVEENLERVLAFEREYEYEQQQKEESEETEREKALEKERKQRIKEENARKFLEAEEEMVELQRRMEEEVQSRRVSLTQQVSVVEEPCVRKVIKPLYDPDRVTQSVKTQFGQSNKEPYSLSPKSLHFPSISDDASEEQSSSFFEEKPSLDTQLMETVTSVSPVEDMLEREAPDGEDNTPTINYTDEYLRSLDGIKQRPLKREDGSGRRRAFKKRRSSGSSNSSRDSRNSREEEIKMFTSLEEEEMHDAKNGDEDFTAIKYSRDTPSTLKVKTHHRRHKRSPVKDTKVSDESLRSSLEMLNEESTNPWGEVVPEHYKNTAFWKREKGISIDEEEIESLKATQEQETEAATNLPNASSFEDATQSQHEEALKTLQNQSPKESKKEQENLDTKDLSRNDKNTNLQTSQSTERSPSPALSSKYLRLRRSPHIEEFNQYEDHEVDSVVIKTDITQQTIPNITIEPSTAERETWRDQYGLLMEGLSDFYDFTASVNPSRSRSTSRNPSRSTTPNSKPTSPCPKNVSYEGEKGNLFQTLEKDNEFRAHEAKDFNVYDDTGDVDRNMLDKRVFREFIDGLQDSENPQLSQDSQDFSKNNFCTDNLENVADDPTSNTENLIQKELPLISVDTFNESPTQDDLEISKDCMISLDESLRTNRSHSHSRARSPLPAYDMNTEIEAPSSQPESVDSECSKDKMNTLVQSLRSERCRSRSRSKSPLPTPDNIQRGIEKRRSKKIQQNDELFQKLEITPPPDQEIKTDAECRCNDAPSIIVDCIDDNKSSQVDSNENMADLVASLRIARTNSSSRSKSPMRVPTESNLRRSVETRRSKLIQQNDALLAELTDRTHIPDTKIEVQCVYSDVDNTNETASNVFGATSSRTTSHSPLKSDEFSKDNSEYKFVSSSDTKPNFEYNLNTHEVLSNLSDYYDFRELLNREASLQDKMEEESFLTDQHLVDEDGLKHSQTANEDGELRTSGEPNNDDEEPEEFPNESGSSERADHMGCDFDKDKLRQLKCTPTTPDYDRSISSEWKDIQRIKEEILASGFKRSTYAGESMDLGSEYEVMRRRTAQFRRSESCSRSPGPTEEEIIEKARHNAAETREIQEEILAEITTDIRKVTDYEARHGAKPKTDGKKLSAAFGKSSNMSSAQYEEMRRNAAEFRRSQSRSRSPLGPQESAALAEIDAEAAKRELQDRILDEIEKTTINFQDFSRHLNVEFENDRRASDSVLIQKPEITTQFQDNVPYLDMDPEEYHHHRRYSLRQEEPTEQYPGEDYVCVSQIEVRSPSGTRTWTSEDYYSADFATLDIDLPDSLKTSVETIDDFNMEQLREDDGSDGSEDERRTVVEVDDEIEEDIFDFNDHGLADESHHEQSECEEAEREVDRYADRQASDWKSIENLDEASNSGNTSDVLNEGGAVGGSNDSDSFVIDEIYSDAIRNRKQSGILRDYDSIIQDMQQNYVEDSSDRREEVDYGLTNEKDRYAIWAKTRNMERLTPLRGNGSESILNFIENEKRDSERRYLGDASMAARNSARLRSRYGYMPILQGTAVEEIDVDLNYKPQREYNWRKNFKLDDNEKEDQVENKDERKEYSADITEDQMQEQYTDMRKFSIGGDSITLFSRSPEKEILSEVIEEETEHISAELEGSKKAHEEVTGSTFKEPMESLGTIDKPKKKKSRRKTRRESKGTIGTFARDEDDSESQNYSRRSSCIQIETDSPKRKSHSRRSSKSSLFNEDITEVNPTRDSFGYAGSMEGLADENADVTAAQAKKTKKRKAKDLFLVVREPEIKEEHSFDENGGGQLLRPMLPISAAISPASAARNVLSTLSPANSVCATPSPSETDATESRHNHSTSAAVTTATSSSIIDQFDILKDGNFYPLF